ncbi:MAG: hypothetical protein MI923_30900 [Phycisphaerales bacterium]|nr:hypothetical protein [Phycisphaerales bacterium]
MKLAESGVVIRVVSFFAAGVGDRRAAAGICVVGEWEKKRRGGSMTHPTRLREPPLECDKVEPAADGGVRMDTWNAVYSSW